MLSREGWYLLDDSETALIKGDGFSVRQDRSGNYQDLYLFAYGDNYIRGLRDLRKLTGAAPLLPRKAFGIWFSRWWPYADSAWKQIAARFKAEGVPLDTISLDTDFKSINNPAGAAIAATAVGAEGLPTRGMAGTGTPTCSLTRRAFSTGPMGRAWRSGSTSTPRSTRPTPASQPPRTRPRVD